MTNGVLGITGIGSDLATKAIQGFSKTTTEETQSFASVLKNAITGTLNDTQGLIDVAEEAEIQFALGNADNTHDLQIAQQQANLAVAYTVAIRDRFLDAYKEIMNMQI